MHDSAPGHSGADPPSEGAPVYSYRSAELVDGQLCWTTHYTHDPAEARAFEHAYRDGHVQSSDLALLPTCPSAPTAPALPSPDQLARDFWDVRHLPSPTLDTVPDYAVVGKRVYLQIRGAPTTTFDVPNPLGAPVHIEASSRYVVDWGDGTPPTTTTSQGGPWPTGDVTHVYDTSSPARTITVRQEWSATWTAGPGPTQSGTLDNLQTVGSLTISVEQVQPVRNR